MSLVAVFTACFCFSQSVSAASISPLLYNDADLKIPFSIDGGTTTVAINGSSSKKIKEIIVRTNYFSGSYKLELLNDGEYASGTISAFSGATETTFRSQDGSCHGNNSCVTVSYAMPGTGYSYISSHASQAAIRFNKTNWLGSLKLNGQIYVYYAA